MIGGYWQAIVKIPMRGNVWHKVTVHIVDNDEEIPRQWARVLALEEAREFARDRMGDPEIMALTWFYWQTIPY